MCSKFKSKSKQILEVGTCAFSNLRKFTIELNANPGPDNREATASFLLTSVLGSVRGFMEEFIFRSVSKITVSLNFIKCIDNSLLVILNHQPLLTKIGLR